MPRPSFQPGEEETSDPQSGGGAGPGKKGLKIAEYKTREYLEKGKGKRKERAKMGSGNESGETEESTNGKKSGLTKEGQYLDWRTRITESLA